MDFDTFGLLLALLSTLTRAADNTSTVGCMYQPPPASQTSVCTLPYLHGID